MLLNLCFALMLGFQKLDNECDWRSVDTIREPVFVLVASDREVYGLYRRLNYGDPTFWLTTGGDMVVLDNALYYLTTEIAP